MIGQLTGILLQKRAPQIVLLVQGVGYEIDVPMSTFFQLPDVGNEITILTHFVVREDAQLLYGFLSEAEKKLFRTLLKVSGVGPRMALTILSKSEPDEFVRAVLNHDSGKLESVPGIGKKTAERLIVEMRDRLQDWHEIPLAISSSKTAEKSVRSQIFQDAVAALVSLGYKANEASRLIHKLDDGVMPSQELIRCALKEMA